jgi:hypothetical protein
MSQLISRKVAKFAKSLRTWTSWRRFALGMKLFSTKKNPDLPRGYSVQESLINSAGTQSLSGLRKHLLGFYL